MTLTVGDLKRHLAAYDDDFEIEFDGGLTFCRVKTRGDNLAMVEFNEFQAMLSPKFRKKFPEVKVAFCSVESDGSVVQEVGVPEL
ncbi:hypothetical protein [Tateyamaria pelophila]|uniref:hypothetical protein n=1 Tax=Tateyamaria pelophila TaxID=328415 RepID=UPI001CBCD33A|nr:hypothetical protein [Tateyamaria pelophila]